MSRVRSGTKCDEQKEEKEGRDEGAPRRSHVKKLLLREEMADQQLLLVKCTPSGSRFFRLSTIA